MFVQANKDRIKACMEPEPWIFIEAVHLPLSKESKQAVGTSLT